MWKLHPPPSPEKSPLPISLQPPSKSWGPVKAPYLKIWLEVQLPPADYVHLMLKQAAAAKIINHNDCRYNKTNIII